MCDPLTIAGIALTAGSTVMNSIGASKAAAARDDALAAERVRQKSLDSEAQTLNTQSQDRYQDFSGQQDAQSQQLGDFFQNQTVAEPTTAEALPTSTSNITVQEEANQRAKARDFTGHQAAALGNLRAFGDLLGGIGRQQARDASLVGQIGGFKTGSSNVLPLELDEASHKGDGFKLFGDILGGLGSVATMGGMSGQGLFGFGAKAAAPATKSIANTAARVGGIGSDAMAKLRLTSLYPGAH